MPTPGQVPARPVWPGPPAGAKQLPCMRAYAVATSQRCTHLKRRGVRQPHMHMLVKAAMYSARVGTSFGMGRMPSPAAYTPYTITYATPAKAAPEDSMRLFVPHKRAGSHATHSKNVAETHSHLGPRCGVHKPGSNKHKAFSNAHQAHAPKQRQQIPIPIGSDRASVPNKCLQECVCQSTCVYVCMPVRVLMGVC